eukprot:6454866-Amphidinium_carterae.1
MRVDPTVSPSVSPECVKNTRAVFTDAQGKRGRLSLNMEVAASLGFACEELCRVQLQGHSLSSPAAAQAFAQEVATFLSTVQAVCAVQLRALQSVHIP